MSFANVILRVYWLSFFKPISFSFLIVEVQKRCQGGSCVYFRDNLVEELCACATET